MNREMPRTPRNSRRFGTRMRSLIFTSRVGADVSGMLYGRFTTEGTENTEKKGRVEYSSEDNGRNSLSRDQSFSLAFFSVLSVPSVVNLLVESVGRRRIWA